MLVGGSWAAEGSPGLTSVGSEKAGSPTPLKSLDAGTFTLPQELGYIQESVKLPDSSRTVIHIQDAHCNYAAQKQISEILKYLTDEYGVNAVNCEGGAKGYDLSPFTDIPEKDIRERTSDFFVKEGVVSAAEFFAVNNPEKVKLWGVEDADLYIKNLKVYRDSLAHKQEVDRYIKEIAYILDNLKRHIYSSELLELDAYYNKYKSNTIPFKEYITYLIVAARKQMIDVKSFSNIYLLSQTLEQEDNINFKKANNEKDEVVDKLKKVLSRNEMEELMTKVAQLKAEKISQAAFYAYLVKKAKSIKLELGDYPELQKYVIYISLYGAIDRTKITKEMDTLEDRVKESLYENDTQRELGVLSKNLTLTRNIFNISLTRDDYTYYVEHKASFAVSNYVRFIDRFAPLYKMDAVLDKNIGMLDTYREAMDQFYECSLERDKAFVKNIKFTDHDRPNSIIITGGFHTENLRELFKKEGVSYISIMPKFKNPPGYESPYLKRLAGQRTALENVIDTAIPAVLNLQVVEILSKLGMRPDFYHYREHLLFMEKLMEAIYRAEKATGIGRVIVRRSSKDLNVPENKREDDKMVLFTNGPGGGTPEPKDLGQANNFNARTLGLEGIEIIQVSDVPHFEFKLTEQAGLTAAATVPLLPGTHAPPGIIPPAEKPPVVESVPAEAVDMYAAAQKLAPEIVNCMRAGAPTYDIVPAASIEDISPQSSNNRAAEHILGQHGQNIHAKCYLAAKEEDRRRNLNKLLKRTMPDFLEDINKDTRTRMAIRFIADEKGKEAKRIQGFVRGYLIARGYKKQVADIIISKYIKLIPISIENVQHVNASIDLFADIGMMECDRYMTHDYTGTMPPELGTRVVALLKVSIENFNALAEAAGGESVEAILKKIFGGFILRIKPVDWRSIDEWHKAQESLLHSV